MRRLATALDEAGVDPERNRLILPGEPADDWRLCPEGSVWLRASADGWELESGGIGPHYEYWDVLRSFAGGAEACEVFLRELSGSDEPFGEEQRRFSAECVRLWWEDEVRIALEDPPVGAQRRRWRERWREREAAGEPAMSIDEMLDAFVAAGGERESLHVEGRDDNRVLPDATVVIGRDHAGRWWRGRHNSRMERLVKEYRFASEGEFCRHFYDDSLGPVWMTPPLTLAQWREQRALARENEEERRAGAG